MLVLGYDTPPGTKPSLSDCLYFSVVTISSLGYGDIRPVGFGRFVAGAEVLVGLVIVGLWVSSLASGRSEVLLDRLHGSSVDERFRAFRENVVRLTSEFGTLVAGTAAAQSTRLYSSGPESDVAVLDELLATVDGASRYLRYEVANRLFFETTSPKALGRLLGTLLESTIALEHIVSGMPTGSSKAGPHAGNCHRVVQILMRFEVVGQCAVDNALDGNKSQGGALMAAVDAFYAKTTEV
jgi:hypothetical protein